MGGRQMKKIQFKCTLLSDVIINQKAATKGRLQTLDFIPGSNFLGIAASVYGELSDEESLLAFHSGKVRFGDAHPGIQSNRSLRIPLSFSYPKLSSIEKELYVHHAINDHQKLKEKQLKQCRTGFYVFNEKKATEVKVDNNFAIKSAYDREKRRSADEQLYGYESIRKGIEMYFELTYDDDVPEDLITKLKSALIGNKRVGRSRTAQYGLVDIKEEKYTSVSSSKADNELIIYADGRLIFLDDYGNPTYIPELKDFGLVNGKVDWKKSQIRTFQYSPWNFKRGTRDTDRCGIEKGCVIVIKDAVVEDDLKEYVGFYQNEGFGKVIYNPDFFEVKDGDNGRAVWQVVKPDNNSKNQDEKKQIFVEAKSPLIDYLKNQKKEQESETKIYERVNVFVEKNGRLFKGKTFASQWGNIRRLAMQHPQKDMLKLELFTKTKDGKPYAYLTHGVAKEKWEERKRKETFEEFFDSLPEDKAQFAIVNLAAEMAKICRREKK